MLVTCREPHTGRCSILKSEEKSVALTRFSFPLNICTCPPRPKCALPHGALRGYQDGRAFLSLSHCGTLSVSLFSSCVCVSFSELFIYSLRALFDFHCLAGRITDSFHFVCALIVIRAQYTLIENLLKSNSLKVSSTKFSLYSPRFLAEDLPLFK